MNVVSLFSGVGGFDLACERAGMTVVAAVEIDKAARKVLARRFPHVRLYEDVTRVHAPATCRGCDDCLPAGRIDAVCGGFPCQDLSVAGRRAGLAGLRSGLFYELARIVAETAPRWVILENVPGLLSSNNGRDMAAVVGTLGDLGYGWAYRVLDAQFFGVPQRRRRVFVVGCLGNRAAPVQVLLEPESRAGNPPTSRKAGQGVAASLTAGVAASRGVSSPGRRQEDDINLVPALTTRCGNTQDDQQSMQLVTHTLTAEGHDASEDGTGRGVPLVVAPTITASWGSNNGAPGSSGKDEAVIAFAWQAGGNNSASGAFNDDGTTPTLPKSQTLAVAIPLALRGREGGAELEAGEDGEPYNALRAGDGGSSRQSLIAVGDQQQVAVRRLTPMECERLQGFPDLWTAGQADSPRYKQMGNAAPVPVVEWLMRRLATANAASTAPDDLHITTEAGTDVA